MQSVLEIDRICDKIETPDLVICVRGICSRLTPICYRGAAEVADWSQPCADAEDTDYRSGVSILSQILNLENDTCMSPIVKGNQVYNIFNRKRQIINYILQYYKIVIRRLLGEHNELNTISFNCPPKKTSLTASYDYHHHCCSRKMFFAFPDVGCSLH